MFFFILSFFLCLFDLYQIVLHLVIKSLCFTIIYVRYRILGSSQLDVLLNKKGTQPFIVLSHDYTIDFPLFQFAIPVEVNTASLPIIQVRYSLLGVSIESM